jgi:hypothetical protein
MNYINEQQVSIVAYQIFCFIFYFNFMPVKRVIETERKKA